MRIQEFVRRSRLFRVFRDYSLLESQVNRGLAPHGISFQQALVLSAVFFEQKRGATPTELRKALGLPKSRISQILTRLDELGLIERTVNDEDARSFRIGIPSDQRRRVTSVINALERAERVAEKLA